MTLEDVTSCRHLTLCHTQISFLLKRISGRVILISMHLCCNVLIRMFLTINRDVFMAVKDFISCRYSSYSDENQTKFLPLFRVFACTNQEITF